VGAADVPQGFFFMFLLGGNVGFFCVQVTKTPKNKKKKNAHMGGGNFSVNFSKKGKKTRTPTTWGGVFVKGHLVWVVPTHVSLSSTGRDDVA